MKLALSWWLALTIGMAVTGCAGDDDTSPTPDHQPPVVTTAAAEGSPTPGLPGYIASPQPVPGRTADDVVSGPLTFNQIRVYAHPTSGTHVVHANVMNTEASFLNDVGVSWRILDESGQTIDAGEIVIATLAPGETTSVELEGSAPHDDDWAAVEFVFIGATQ